MMGRSYWLLLALGALAACGDDSNRKIADAPPGHQDDAPGQMDAPNTNSPVTVTATSGAGPSAGVHVYFQANDSTVISSTVTDSAGTASAVMPNGGFVSVVECVFGKGNSCDIFTWAGVKPGDHLQFNDGSAPNPTVLTVTFVLPDDGAHTIGSYSVQTTCGGDTFNVNTGSAVAATTTGQITAFCATADVLVVANDIDGQPVSSFYVPAQAFTDNGVVDYSAKTYTNSPTRNYTFTNNTDMIDISVGEVFFTQRNALWFSPTTAIATGNPALGSMIVPAAPTGVIGIVDAYQYTADTQTRREVNEWGSTGAYTLDWAAHLLPDYVGDPTFNAGTHALAWTTTGGAVTSDVSYSSVYHFTSGTNLHWYEYGPGGTSLAYPVLPVDPALMNIDFNFTNLPTIEEIRSIKVPGGYDGIRASVFGASGTPPGATGVLSQSTYIPISTLAATRHAPKKRDVMPRWIRHR